ncbi:MAG: hypothetical protein AMS27_04950 [Bacteroides sp. SM23_62_1]|nr:MAG: hypothetical protein AMS27_04950 [Bacteroides sp. SM23_62_1]
MMKKILVLFFSLFFSVSVFCQDQEIQTLFGRGARISGFGGPIMSFTMVNGEFGHMMGGGGGVLLGDFFLGGYGEGLTNYIEDIEGGNKIEFGHGGFWTGYSFFGIKPLHPAFFLQAGWGNITLHDPDGYDVYYNDNIFVVNPTIELEMNFTRFFRLSVGGHYRLVTGVDTPNLTGQKMSGPGVFLGFKFGWF